MTDSSQKVKTLTLNHIVMMTGKPIMPPGVLAKVICTLGQEGGKHQTWLNCSVRDGCLTPPFLYRSNINGQCQEV